MAKKKVSFTSALYGSTENLVRKWLHLPPVSTRRHTLTSWATTGVQRRVIEWLGLERADKLALGWPVDIFETLDRYVQSRGGHMNIGEGLTVPLLKLERRTAVTLPSMWIAYIQFESENANWKALQAAEEQLEDALARECGQQLNIRIMSKPARIEIDNPKPPLVSLTEAWGYIMAEWPSLAYALGAEFHPSDGRVECYNMLNNANEFSVGFFGASGSGKTQAMMAALLTMCAVSSPADLAMIIVDPKAIDFPPFNGIPHLAQPVITEVEDAVKAIYDVLAEMDRRVKAQDASAAQQRIVLAIDELGDLFMQLPKAAADELDTALTRLAQKGRAWGISLMLGSQRAVNESFPKSVQVNMPCMIVGRVKTSQESYFASGVQGSDAHRLPGKGALMIYEPGREAVRLQGYFVADSNKVGYAEEIGKFTDDIVSRWAGVAPHYGQTHTGSVVALDINPATGKPLVKAPAPPQSHDLRAMVEDAVRTVLLEMATVKEATDEGSEVAPAPMDLSILDTISEELLCALENVYNADTAKFSQRKVRELIVQHEGKRRSNPSDEKAIHTAIINYLT